MRSKLVLHDRGGVHVTEISGLVDNVPQVGDLLRFEADSEYAEYRVLNRTFVFPQFGQPEVHVHYEKLETAEIGRFPT